MFELINFINSLTADRKQKRLVCEVCLLLVPAVIDRFIDQFIDRLLVSALTTQQQPLRDSRLMLVCSEAAEFTNRLFNMIN